MKMDLIRGTFLSLYLNLLALLHAGPKHFLQQTHLLRLRLTRFTALMIVYRLKDLFSVMAVVRYLLSSLELPGPNLKRSNVATRTYAPHPLVSSSVWGAQKVSSSKILPSMAELFVFGRHKPNLTASTTLPLTSSLPRPVRSPCS
jgi:hypothetical protein